MRIIVVFISVFLVLTSCKREEQVIVKGNIINGTDVKLIFNELDEYFTRHIDSTVLTSNGKFRFKTKLKVPDFFQLKFDSIRSITLLLEPNEKVYVSANLNDLPNSIEISGSTGSVLLNDLNNNLNSMQIKLDSVAEQFSKTIDPLIREKLSEEYEEIINSHRKYSIKFILKNMGSMASYAALYQQYNNGVYVFNSVKDLQYFKLVTDSLSKKYSRSKHITELKKNTQNMLNNYNSQRILNLVSEKDFHLPDIELPDSKNKLIKLSSLKGKYILLNFWASWNQQSVDNNIKLKSVYNKYHQKGFEIYNVSVDNSMNTMQKAVRFDALPWINVIDSTYPDSYFMKIYNINTLPGNYLVGKNFESVIAKNLSPEEVNLKLSELLN